MVAHEAQRLQVFAAILDQASRASDDDTAVVHRVVERCTSHDEPVDDRDRDADITADGRPQRGVGGRPVHVQPVIRAAVGHRQHDRATVGDDPDMGDQPGIEYFEDRVAVVFGTDRATSNADPIAGGAARIGVGV